MKADSLQPSHKRNHYIVRIPILMQGKTGNILVYKRNSISQMYLIGRSAVCFSKYVLWYIGIVNSEGRGRRDLPVVVEPVRCGSIGSGSVACGRVKEDLHVRPVHFVYVIGNFNRDLLVAKFAVVCGKARVIKLLVERVSERGDVALPSC